VTQLNLNFPVPDVVKYEVTVGYIDDSYWDDGSRWTSKVFVFDTAQLARTFISTTLQEGLRVQAYTFQVDRAHIKVARVSRRLLALQEFIA